jgi:tetratricopeptide (TPR) repeat protein
MPDPQTVICGAALALAAAWSQMMTFHARIVINDGVPPPVTPLIIPDPIGGCTIVNVFGNGTVEYTTGERSRSDECQVTIRLAGYRKTDVTLRNGGVIVMGRLGSHSNPTVSLVTLKAPEDARRAFEKGVAAVSGKKWAAARKEFERAVASYPDYAPAWSALGEVLAEESKPREARAACEQAVKADPKYAKAWVQLTHLAVEEGRMQDALKAADRAVQLDPGGFPAVYVDQAIASLDLQHVRDAEESARRAVDLDSDHELPRAERVLGLVLAAKGDRKGAIEHFKKYLKMSPKAADAAKVKQRIAGLEAGATKSK